MPGIKKFKLTNFPLSPGQKERFREVPAVDVKINQGHASLCIHEGKIFRIHVHGSDRPPILVAVKKIFKKGSGTFVTLERKCNE